MNRQKILNILLAALLLSVVFLAWSNATRYGNRAQKGGNYVLAKMWYLIAAHSGDGAAQNNLAGFYAEGLGGDRSDRLAVKWFEKAAAAGVSAATFNLSNFYEEGRGVPRDIRKATTLLEDLAKQGDSVARNICTKGLCVCSVQPGKHLCPRYRRGSQRLGSCWPVGFKGRTGRSSQSPNGLWFHAAGWNWGAGKPNGRDSVAGEGSQRPGYFQTVAGAGCACLCKHTGCRRERALHLVDEGPQTIVWSNP